MKTDHTPGPWNYHSYMASGRRFGIETADHKHGLAGIAPNETASSGLPMEQHEANARLICAAPDLLESLVNLLRETDDGTNLCARDFVVAAKAAIAKATGSR